MKRDFSGTAPSPYGNLAGGGNIAPPPAMRDNHRLSEHMFEALLALYPTTNDQSVWHEIERQVSLMIRLFDPQAGFLPEVYDQDGKAVPTANFNVGHLFEWAVLFSQAVELGTDPKLIELCSRNSDMGIKIGVDRSTGGTWTSATANGETPPRRNMLWWPECKTIKAIARYAIRHGRSDLWPVFDRYLEFVRTNFFYRSNGGWFETVVPREPRENLGARAYIKVTVDGPEWGS